MTDDRRLKRDADRHNAANAKLIMVAASYYDIENMHDRMGLLVLAETFMLAAVKLAAPEQPAKQRAYLEKMREGALERHAEMEGTKS